MKKTTVIYEIQAKTNFPYKNIEKVVNATLSVIIESLKEGEPVSLYGFGSFRIEQRSAKEVYIPGTKKLVQLEARNVVKFIPSKKLKNLVESSEV